MSKLSDQQIISFKIATISDVIDLVSVFDLYRQFYGQPSDLSVAEKFLSERLRMNDSVIFMAINGSSTIGFVQLYPSFSSVSARRLWILNDLFVVQERRCQGIGIRLLEIARGFAIETSAKGLELSTQTENVQAQRLYEKQGYIRDTAFFHYELIF